VEVGVISWKATLRSREIKVDDVFKALDARKDKLDGKEIALCSSFDSYYKDKGKLSEKQVQVLMDIASRVGAVSVRIELEVLDDRQS
jgi:hypothetical protein